LRYDGNLSYASLIPPLIFIFTDHPAPLYFFQTAHPLLFRNSESDLTIDLLIPEGRVRGDFKVRLKFMNTVKVKRLWRLWRIGRDM